MASSPIKLGDILELQRGDLHWRISVPTDGSLNEHGLIPYFIEWPSGKNPSSTMADAGLSLNKIELEHPVPEQLLTQLRALQIDHLATIKLGEKPRLNFTLSTPELSDVTIY